jgi:cytochrome b6-f complex iron-sulfur subunit
MRQDTTSRRTLLRYGAAVAACACAGCTMPAAREPDVVANPAPGVIRLTQAQSAALLASEGSLLVKLEGRKDKVLVVHHADDTLHAVSAICTHMGCTVGYDKEKGRIVCPCHGSQFAWDGSVLHGPAKRPLKQYKVTNDNGQVLLYV